MRDDETIGRRGWTHDAGTAEVLGAPERSLDVRDADAWWAPARVVPQRVPLAGGEWLVIWLPG